ncbi:hypothetical protein DFA_02899 [Cavenderia fasciculata]|uniref:IPT/TIG domain-containing protein n=1 Tax=Cavenderia fasciculata TaxID=261658 RepID=F4PIS6_CACFS|nr:uncharacterized protein DFA_02899 [Cavenderia fasciculata]EGG24655.1 hypothetical protein DFA_02899 [Cavenderia fasciculata]|eukprot:XP_004362506.1 hypothetical protein DFA_02899 [Cavenderia fasciculata]
MSHLIVIVVAVLMLLLFYISPIHCENYPQGARVWETSEGGNGHGYIGLLSTLTIKNAENECLAYGSSRNSTFRSYLVALDSKQECDFIRTYYWNPPVWVSGKDIRGNGNYTYSSGPATNQPLFNMYSGQCWGYCPFEAGEPSLTPAEDNIYIRGPTSNFNTADVLDVASSICELQPISEVYIPSIGTNGGSITINNLSQFNIQTINITFSNPTKQLEKSCQITSKQGTSVTCTVPPLSGLRNVTVQDDSGVSSTHYAWQPYPPFIKAVYPSFTANGLVTLIGDNFGDNTNNTVAVSVSTSNIPCHITFVSSNQIFCKLESSRVGHNKLLPISISVDDVYTQTFKPYILCDKQFEYIQPFYLVENEKVNRLMIDKVTMGATPNAPYIGAIESEEIYQCFNQSLNIKDFPTLDFGKVYHATK